MNENNKGLWATFGKWNFIILFRLSQFLSLKAGRNFLYAGLRDKSIYEDSYKSTLLKTKLWGKEFPNPLGIAAGFDTSFKYNDELMQYCFGFEEFGTFTMYPKVSPFKVNFSPVQKALLVDSPFFRNEGIKFAQKQLIERRHLPYIAGINISSNLNPDDDDKAEINVLFEKIENELVGCVQHTAPYCDYITVNLSHPTLAVSSLIINLGLLKKILLHLKDVIQKVAPILKTKLLIKVPLDLTKEQISMLCETMLEAGIDGVIVGGYALRDKHKHQSHFGYHYICGKPLKDDTMHAVAEFYKVLRGKIPIIASGGVFSGGDAFDMIQSGANLIQIHSAIVYRGPSVGRKINKRLADILRRHRFKSVSEAVGSKFLD